MILYGMEMLCVKKFTNKSL